MLYYFLSENEIVDASSFSGACDMYVMNCILFKLDLPIFPSGHYYFSVLGVINEKKITL